MRALLTAVIPIRAIHLMDTMRLIDEIKTAPISGLNFIDALNELHLTVGVDNEQKARAYVKNLQDKGIKPYSWSYHNSEIVGAE